MGIRNTFGGAVLAVGMILPAAACAQDASGHSQPQRAEITQVAANDIANAPTEIDSTISVGRADWRNHETLTTTSSVVAAAMRMTAQNQNFRGRAILVYFGSNEDDLVEIQIGASEANNVADNRHSVGGIIQAEPSQDHPAGTYMIMLYGADLLNTAELSDNSIDSFSVRSFIMMAHQTAREVRMAQNTSPAPS